MLDANQVIKKCFDSTKNALRVQGVSGSLDGQITWDAGLGAITHILGPTDQPLKITANTSRNLQLDGDVIEFQGPIQFSTGLGAIDHITGPTDQTLSITSGIAAGPTPRNIDITSNAAMNLAVTGGTSNMTFAVKGTTTILTLDAAQEALVTGGGIVVGTGLGAITHLYGPTDGDQVHGPATGYALRLDGAQKRAYTAMAVGTANVITVGGDDYVIGVDCSGAAKQVNLPAVANHLGRILVIKDQSGDSGVNNITVTPNGTEKIDEAATYVISSNYGSVTLIALGTAGNHWAVI